MSKIFFHLAFFWLALSSLWLAGGPPVALASDYPTYTGTFATASVSMINARNYRAPYIYSDSYLLESDSTVNHPGLAHASAALTLAAFPHYDEQGDVDFSAASQTG
ncbi:hypothetical protein IJJ12_00380, partial [bacterium]|nr:hypothetical protein [bacterium]